MNSQQFLILAVLSVGSLIWGGLDLRRKKLKGTSYEVMSIIQVVGGFCGVVYLAYLSLK